MVVSIIANGSSPHFVYHYPVLKEKYYNHIRNNYEFFKSINSLGNSESMAKVALLFSQSTADMLAGEHLPTDLTLFKSPGEMRRAFSYSLYGASEMLFRLHVPFDIIHERTVLETPLDKYNVIVLPNVMFMGEEIVEKLTIFSQKGKVLIADQETSLFTSDGEFRRGFGLSDALGVEFIGREDLPFYDYLYMPPNNALTSHPYVPTMPRKVKVRSYGKVLAYFTKKRRGVYARLTESEDPAVTIYENNAYIAGNFFETYWAYRFPEYSNIFRGLLPKEALILVESNLPGSVEVEFRKTSDKVFMFLINYTGGMERPIRKIVKIKDIKCKLKLKGVSQAFSYAQNANLRFREANGVTELEIPVLGNYDVIEFV